jgi:hypothetical protein
MEEPFSAGSKPLVIPGYIIKWPARFKLGSSTIAPNPMLVKLNSLALHPCMMCIHAMLNHKSVMLVVIIDVEIVVRKNIPVAFAIYNTYPHSTSNSCIQVLSIVLSMPIHNMD